MIRGKVLLGGLAVREEHVEHLLVRPPVVDHSNAASLSQPLGRPADLAESTAALDQWALLRA